MPVEEPRQDGWVTIKVAAAFGGFTFLPWWLALSTNSANPRLEIGLGGIRYRALVAREARFSQIAEVDVRTAWRTVNLVVRFRDSSSTFSANVRHRDEAARALRLLNGQVPLSERARQVLEQQPAPPSGA